MRELLVWAYKRELVRYCEGRAGGYAPGRGGVSATGAVCRALERGMTGEGPLMRASGFAVHADAEWVHGLVRTLDRDEYWLVVRMAEADATPEWNPQVETMRVLPVLKANGRPRMITCPRSGRPVACRMQVVGLRCRGGGSDSAGRARPLPRMGAAARGHA